jgi:carbon-monoxide dehydrogenase large subunit
MGTVSSSWIGQSIRRREDARLLQGQGRYLDDLPLPDALEAAVLRSPHAHARIARLDAAAALSLPGVVAILDGPGLASRLAPLTTAHWRTPPAIQERVRPRLRQDQQPLLAVERVKYVGEPVALVAAEDRYLAEDALERIEVEYEPLPIITNVEQALRPDAPVLNEAWDDNVAVAFELDKGDLERAFAEAHVVVRERFRSHRYTGVPIETRGVAAVLDPHNSQLTVWSSTQVPHALRDLLASLFDLSASRSGSSLRTSAGGSASKDTCMPKRSSSPCSRASCVVR